jgi:Ca2+-binding RTX toxin-like protein
MQLIVRLLFGALILAIGGGAISATAASMSTPASSAGTYNAPITPDDLKPSDCAGITVTDIVTGSGTIAGTGVRNELILGSPGVDTIDGVQGDDCIHAGGSDDDITGGQGTDVCIGGGNPGDTFATCETVVP